MAELPESSRKVLARIADELRGGFTGELRLSCSQGGVRRVECTEQWDPKRVAPKNEVQ